MKKFDKETDANILMSLDMMVQIMGGTIQKSCNSSPNCAKSCKSKCKPSCQKGSSHGK